MSEKTFRVYGSSSIFWTVIIRASSREEARRKAERGEFFGYEEDPYPTEIAVGDVEEVGKNG